jgi:hypothetical protein
LLANSTDYDSQSTTHLSCDNDTKQLKRKQNKSSLLKKRCSDKNEYKLEEGIAGEPRAKKIKIDKPAGT